jgi:hypothetical protein
MKVIFLDFDGVMNPEKNYQPDCNFSKAAVKNLNTLLDEVPDAKIVVSSAWRHRGIMFVKEVLKKNGVTSGRVVGITDLKHETDRGHHIERYVKDHSIETYVILDDRRDMDSSLSHLVHVNPVVGLTEKNVEDAVKMLKK